MLHENSIKSYQEEKRSGKTEVWRKRVFDMFAMSPNSSFTDREVINTLDAKDFNLVRPEITRLINDGLLTEYGKTRCIFTGKSVRHSSWTGKSYFSKGNKKAVV